ncbi:tail sheath protein [Paenibacillus alvei TS-15]|uniref:Tail sheath protein n=1 Tax=Paenibacillus alvei TS-15 TaxID=1117108 RepID=S9TTZ0_PAEAL|nr:phage tail sheath C-terminal domain-containing protein [Paenibacillus alvei]EPY05771.1 tail sheath protein [Paenibacillus alvei TS-15]
MPIQPTYPGVYVEEIPSGVHPIVGVSTSIAAFVDFFPRGPVNKATQITSFGDFQRIFGGLDKRSEASYAIQQFYLNGGQLAWVIRVNSEKMKMAPATFTLGSTLNVTAASPGTWAGDSTNHLSNKVQVAIDNNTPDPTSQFNLAVREVATVNGKPKVVNSEIYRNLTMTKNTPRYAVDVVNAASALIQLTDLNTGTGTATMPSPTSTTIKDVITSSVLTDPVSDAYKSLDGGKDGNLFDSEGQLKPDQFTIFSEALIGHETEKTGMYALDNIAPFHFNILCIPATANLETKDYLATYVEVIKYCEDKRAVVLVDIPTTIDTVDKLTNNFLKTLDSLRINPNATTYFPRLHIPDVLNENRPRNVGPSGTLAGIYARTDATRGVWKAPAGTEATLVGVDLPIKLNDQVNGNLNSLGINVLRNFPIYSTVSWGARTLDGADIKASEWKYIPVRRTALFIEQSLYEGLKWVVFEPNAEPLWAQIRLNVGSFMQNLFRQGAFQGQSRKDAYLVKCDSETTTQNDINNGIVNIVVGFAPLKPAEFVIIQLQQMAGQIQV